MEGAWNASASPPPLTHHRRPFVNWRRTHNKALSVALVQHTHTQTGTYLLRRAREQVVAWRAQVDFIFDHHVAVWQNYGHCEPLVESITRMLGSRENVTCVTSDDISNSLPALSYAAVSRMHGAGPHTTWLNKSAATYQWAWNSCDANWLYWFWKRERHQPRQHHYDYVWFLEWDVAWTGNIARIIASFHRLEPGRAMDADFLGHGPRSVTKLWPHQSKLNKTRFKYRHSAWTAQPLLRLSRHLLLNVMKVLAEPEDYMFCELRSATVCMILAVEAGQEHANQPKRNHSVNLGCSMSNFSALVPPNTTFFGPQDAKNPNAMGFSNSYAVGPGKLKFEDLANESLADRLWHRFKWDSSGINSSDPRATACAPPFGCSL